MSDEIDLSHVEIQDHNELMEYIRILLEKVRSLTALYNDNLTLLNDHNEATNAHADIRATILDNANEADTKLDNLRTEINNLINVINGEINALENRAADIEGVNNVQNDRLDSAEYDLSLKIYDSAVSGVGHTGDFDDLLYRPNIVINDADGSNSGAAVKLSKNRTYLKLPSTIKANIVGNVSGDMTGNAVTATKLKTARSINGTNFDGSSNITTANWGTARNVSIQDYNAGHTGSAARANGSSNVTLKLPSTINADIVGYLTGNISGSAGSVAWTNVSGRPWALSQFSNNSGFITSSSLMYINGDRANNAYRIVYGSFNNLSNLSTGRQWVSFSNAFSSAPKVIVTASNPDGNYFFQISTVTTTGFIFELWDGSGNRTINTVAASYIAIGKC